ncbi:MAG: gamma carbonic anhydrase family protein [Aquincola sp.]|nr:gamma carbonic anhydrase family protein [Aquincola sp.]
MSVYRLGDLTPQIDPTAWVAENAVLIGRVVLGPGASVWYGAVLRADNEPIVIGARCNIQDSAVLHTDPGFPLTLGEGVSVGHQAMLHGCTVGDGALVGIQAIVLNGARIGARCLVGAGALVTEGKVFEPEQLIVGAPALVKRALMAPQVEGLARTAAGYVERAQRYRQTLVRIE